MADVGLGQLVTVSGRARSRVLKDAVRDSHPLYKALEDNGGIRRIDGGRTIVEEAKSGQNSTVSWVGEAGTVSTTDQKVLDAAEFEWKYFLRCIIYLDFLPITTQNIKPSGRFGNHKEKQKKTPIPR